MKKIISYEVEYLFITFPFMFSGIFYSQNYRLEVSLIGKGIISIQTCYYRSISIFDKRINPITEMIEFDKRYDIPSIFFSVWIISKQYRIRKMPQPGLNLC